jgi:DNA-binding transcriptional regulator PaaX
METHYTLRELYALLDRFYELAKKENIEFTPGEFLDAIPLLVEKDSKTVFTQEPTLPEKIEPPSFYSFTTDAEKRSATLFEKVIRGHNDIIDYIKQKGL